MLKTIETELLIIQHSITGKLNVLHESESILRFKSIDDEVEITYEDLLRAYFQKQNRDYYAEYVHKIELIENNILLVKGYLYYVEIDLKTLKIKSLITHR